MLVDGLFMASECLTDLAFHPISVNGMFESFFRNTDEHLDWGTTLWPVDGQIYCFERECRHRLTVTLLKERFHQLLADDALLLAKRRSHHLVLAV